MHGRKMSRTGNVRDCVPVDIKIRSYEPVYIIVCGHELLLSTLMNTKSVAMIYVIIDEKAVS